MVLCRTIASAGLFLVCGGCGGRDVTSADPVATPPASPAQRTARASDRLSVGGKSCVVRAGGVVTCWTDHPVDVADVPAAVQVAVGAGHQCALTTTGTVWCWGIIVRANIEFLIGSELPSRILGLSGVVQIAAGDFHSCALLASGRVQCWGAGDEGQLGNGESSDQLSPVPVEGLEDAVEISAGGGFTCARR